MPIADIIKRAWQLSWRHKFLWIFGALTGSSSLPSGNSGGTGFEWLLEDSDVDKFKNMLQGLPTEVAHAVDSGAADSLASAPTDYTLLIILLTLVFLSLTYLMITFRASLIWSVDQLNRGKAISFWDGWRGGRKVFWRFLLQGLYVAALAIAGILVVVIPVMLLVSAEWYGWALGFGIVGILVNIVWFILLTLINELASRYVTLKDLPVLRSVHEAFTLCKQRMGETALLWLVGVAVAIGTGIALVIVLIGLGILAILFGGLLFGFRGFDAIPDMQLLTYGLVAGGIFLLSLITLSGWAGSFISAYWTLGFQRLTTKTS